MRQIIIGHSDSSKLGTYKVVIGGDRLGAMQPKTEQRRVLKKTKRFRSAFTTEQTNYLEEQFKQFQYINREQRQKVASILKIGERPIKIWFQNRRMKEKKENHKEFDDETCGNEQKFDKVQFNNVPTLPSANDHRLYSLPILSFTADSTAYANTNSMKANKVESKDKQVTKPESPNSTTPDIESKESIPRANFYKELNDQEHASSYFNQQPTVDSTVPFTNEDKSNKKISQEYKKNTSAEFSINLCKKYKQHCKSTNAAATDNIAHEGQEMKIEPKPVSKMETDKIISFDLSTDLPPSKKCKVSYPPPPQLPTQVTLNNQMYYPMMPSVYSPPMTSFPPPYVAPDGVMWKPVNFMPVVTSNPPSMNMGHRAPLGHEPTKNCMCNCHEISQQLPVTFPPSLQNPYPQYVITVPFTRNSPSF